ncbi:hypothetical protein C1O35_11055 [Staphylococcus schleiferi]|uniref:XRE family transcriptional regulator n=1 Tax=Staphylococcus schleiferi TaxID=1295 RepID=A0ABX0G0V5_STASC|nr:hypothetical protein [Staphylococcus schleiferi]NHA39523.1 hypothetical protein [Staphylococcus schleiferi]NHA41775.1 hypothetical protein [Staphylococcus schleiferi]
MTYKKRCALQKPELAEKFEINKTFYHKKEALRRFSIKDHLSAIYFGIEVPASFLNTFNKS